MAQPLRIDQLDAVGTLSGTAALPVVQSGATYRATPAAVISAGYALNVKDPRFGATGDGSTDDTAAIQAAIDALPTASPNPGGRVYMPKGVYKISSALTLPDGVVLEGEANGANRTDEQGATLIDCNSIAIGISSTSTFGVGVRRIALKNATTACIKFDSVQFYVLDEVCVFGSSVPTGIWITGTSYFGLINQPNVNGLSGVGAVGVKINAGANENTIAYGCVRQNTTNVEIDNANNIRLFCVDMEGSSSQTGVSVAPTNAADATVIGCRLEGLLNGIVLGTNTTMLCAMGNHYGSATNGIVDNSSASRLGIFEPHLYNAATPGVLAFVMHDASSAGGKIGSMTLKNISGGNEINAGSGKLLLSTTGGNHVDLAGTALSMTERSDPSAPSSNIALLYAKDNGSGKTQLVVRFPTGAVQVIATEP